jgi:glycosyltransferase involved in cell wall biosynthesis
MAPGAGAPAQRVLLVLQSVTVGGMETQCVALATEFLTRGVDVAVVVPESPIFHDLAAAFLAAGTKVERLDTDARGGRASEAARILRLIRFARIWQPDVVHVHTGGPTGGVAIVAAARLLTRATVVLTEHNVPFADPGTRLRLATFLKDRLVHGLIALSARNAAQRRRWLGAPARKFAGSRPGVRVHDNASHTGVTRSDGMRESLGIARSTVVMGSAVRLAGDKGLDDLLRAFANVRREETCELLFVGDGPLRRTLQALANELAVADHVHFAGYHADPAPFFEAMDIFVLAAPTGSGSIALLEAMAHGLPAVITYCGRGEFVVPDQTGLCAPPNDPAGLGRVLLRLARDARLRSDLGAAAAKHVRTNFNVERAAEDLLEIYATAKGGTIPRRLLATSLEDE